MHINPPSLLLLIQSVILLSCINNAQRVVTSPETCLRHSDCDEFSEYCNTLEGFQCHKRGGLNAPCYGNVECSDGLYCGMVDTRRLCLPQSELFKKCDHTSEASCAIDGPFTYKCSPETKTCGYTGFEGDKCISTHHCQIGYYCKDAGSIKGKCTSKLPPGTKCDMYSASAECDGYCARGGFDTFNKGVCVTGSQFGEPCTSDSHCYGYETSLNDPNARGLSKIVCNIAKGSIGICEHERDLIKKEGMKCNPNKDTCDAKRGLSCRRTSTGTKCMFNKFDSDAGGTRFCDINGSFSQCNLMNGIPTECRRNFDDGSPFGNEFKDFFQCLQKKEVVPQGYPCNEFGFTMCEKGTTCKYVPGVETRYFKFARPPRFCVKVKKEGEKCYNKFRFSCDDGLKCEKNVCVKGQPDDDTDTHGYLTVSCDKQPCTPGLECLKDPVYNTKSCELKPVKKTKGSCFKTALTETVSISSSSISYKSYYLFKILLLYN